MWKAQERKQRHRILRHVQCTQTCSRQEHSHPTTRWLTNCRVIYSGDREATSSMFRQTAHREMNGWAGPEMHRYSVAQPPIISTRHYFSENGCGIWQQRPLRSGAYLMLFRIFSEIRRKQRHGAMLRQSFRGRFIRFTGIKRCLRSNSR